jgi:hypothetical protein
MLCLCIVELQVTVNNTKHYKIECCYGNSTSDSPDILVKLQSISNCPAFLFDLIKPGVSRQVFINVSNIKFHGNPNIGCRVDICG